MKVEDSGSAGDEGSLQPLDTRPRGLYHEGNKMNKPAVTTRPPL
jgi:hypothetical protein